MSADGAGRGSGERATIKQRIKAINRAMHDLEGQMQVLARAISSGTARPI